MLKLPDVKAANILIVDDQPANIQLLERLLGTSGYSNVSSTSSPLEVADLHRARSYDLILLDLQMPGFDGFDVLSELQAQQNGGYVPVIVLTAQPSLKLRALQAGARDFISKPFDLLEVSTRIYNMLEVRLLYKEMARYNDVLEQTVSTRTAELRASEQRYRRLTALAADWHWEQDANGSLLEFQGPDKELPGLMSEAAAPDTGSVVAVWDQAHYSTLRGMLADRKPFLDFNIGRTDTNGKRQLFRVSGEPIFDANLRFSGYRCTGVSFSPAPPNDDESST